MFIADVLCCGASDVGVPLLLLESTVTVRALAESRHPFLLTHLPATATLKGVKW